METSWPLTAEGLVGLASPAKRVLARQTASLESVFPDSEQPHRAATGSKTATKPILIAAGFAEQIAPWLRNARFLKTARVASVSDSLAAPILAKMAKKAAKRAIWTVVPPAQQSASKGSLVDPAQTVNQQFATLFPTPAIQRLARTGSGIGENPILIAVAHALPVSRNALATWILIVSR